MSKIWWRDIKGVEIIWHGEWADPELTYKGVVKNYYDIEDPLFELAKKDGIAADDDEAFDDWLKEHKEEVYAMFEIKIRKCRCGNEDISLVKMKNDKLWYCVCSICGLRLIEGGRTETEAKEMWNKHFEYEEEEDEED